MTSTISSTTDGASVLTEIFSNLREQLARYVYCPLFIIGNIGNILNIMVFAREPLRTSVCCIYFLIISIANLAAINIGYLTRLLTILNVPDPSRNVVWYCKGRAYISGLSLTLAHHFLCLIAIDRFLVTSTRVYLRQLSSFKIVKWVVPISCMSWAIFYVHTLIGYENTRGGTSCGRQAGFYSTFTTVSTITIDAILPILIMTVSTLLMLKHVHEFGVRLQGNVEVLRSTTASHPFQVGVQTAGRPPMNVIWMNNHQSTNQVINMRRPKRHMKKPLTKLSLIQVLIYLVFNVPNAVYVVYMLIVTNDKKTPDRLAIESFISLFASIMTYIYCTLNFYIYTLASATYRKKTKEMLQHYFSIIRKRQTRVAFVQN